jgi:hypothetical protein
MDSRHGAVQRNGQKTKWVAVVFLVCAGLLFVAAAQAEDLTIQFASPVAAKTYRMKRSAFVFRAVGCPTETKPEVGATAEGRVDGQRRSLVLKIAPASAPNVFGIFREWPNDGIWVVSLRVKCGSKTAGALVATNAEGLVRESSIVLSHAASEAEIEAALDRGKKLDARID